MNLNKKHPLFSILLLAGTVQLSITTFLVAMECQVQLNQATVTENSKMLVTFFKEGPDAAQINFTELWTELTKYIDSSEILRTMKNKHETSDIISLIITNADLFPLEIQEVLNKQSNERLKIFIDEAKALELLEIQINEDNSKRIHWKILIERLIVLLDNNDKYTAFVTSLKKIRKSSWIGAAWELKPHLSDLRGKLKGMSKEITARIGIKGILNRIFYEG